MPSSNLVDASLSRPARDESRRSTRATCNLAHMGNQYTAHNSFRVEVVHAQEVGKPYVTLTEAGAEK